MDPAAKEKTSWAADPTKIAAVVNRIFFALLLSAVAYFGERGDDGGFIKDVWAAAKTASPFAAMFAILAWLDERRERREAQKQCNDRTIDFIQSTNLQATSITSLHEVVRQLGQNFVSAMVPKAKRRGGSK